MSPERDKPAAALGMSKPELRPHDLDGASIDARQNNSSTSSMKRQEQGGVSMLTVHSLPAPDDTTLVDPATTTNGPRSDAPVSQRRLSSVSLRASLRSVQSQEDQPPPMAASTHSVVSCGNDVEDVVELGNGDGAPVSNARCGSAAGADGVTHDTTSNIGVDALAVDNKATELGCDGVVEEGHGGGDRHQRGSFPQAFSLLPQMSTLKSSVYNNDNNNNNNHSASVLQTSGSAGENCTAHAKSSVPSRIASARGRGVSGGLGLGPAQKDAILGNHVYPTINFTARKTSVTFDMSALPTYELTSTSSSAHTLPQLATGLSSIGGSAATGTTVGRACNAPLDLHTTQDSSKSNLTNSSLPSSYAATLTSASVVDGHKSSPTFGTHLVRIVGHGGGATVDSVNTTTDSTYSVAELTTTTTNTDPSQSVRTSSFTMPGSGSTAAALSSLALRTPPHSSNDSSNTTTTTTGIDSVASTLPPQSLLDGGPQPSASLSGVCRARPGGGSISGTGSLITVVAGEKADTKPSPPPATAVAVSGPGRTSSKAPAPSAARLTRDLLPSTASLTLGLFPTSLSRPQSENGQATVTTTTESSMSQRSMTAEPHSATATMLNSTSSNGSRETSREERAANAYRSGTAASTSRTSTTTAPRARLVTAASTTDLSRTRPSPAVAAARRTEHPTTADATQGALKRAQSSIASSSSSSAAGQTDAITRRSSNHALDTTPPPAGAGAGGQTADTRRADGPQRTSSTDVASATRQLTAPPLSHESFFSHHSSPATSKRNSAIDSPPALSRTTNSAMMHNVTTATAPARRMSATDDNAGHPVALRPAAVLVEHELHSENGAEVQDRLSSGSTTRLQARLVRTAVGSTNNSATDLVQLSGDGGSHGPHIPPDLTHHPFVSSMTSPRVAQGSLRESDPVSGVAVASLTMALPRDEDAAATQHASGDIDTDTAVVVQQQRSLAESGRHGNHGHNEDKSMMGSTSQHHVSPGSGVAAQVSKFASVHLTKPLHDSASFMLTSLSSSSNAATSMTVHVNHDDQAVMTATTPPAGSPSELNTRSPSATTLLCERSSASTVVVLSPFHVEGIQTSAQSTGPSAVASSLAQRTSPVMRLRGRFQSLLHNRSLSSPPLHDSPDEGAPPRTTQTPAKTSLSSPQHHAHSEDVAPVDKNRAGSGAKDEMDEASEQLPRGAVALQPARRSYRAFRSASHNSTAHLTPQWSSVVEGAAAVTTSVAVCGQAYTTVSSPCTAVLSVPPMTLYGGTASQRRSSLTPQKSGATGGRCSLFVVPPSQPAAPASTTTTTTPKTTSLTVGTAATEPTRDEAAAPPQTSSPPRHQSSSQQQQQQAQLSSPPHTGPASQGQQSPPPPSFLFHVANSLSRASSGSNGICPTSQDNSTSTRSSAAMLTTLSEEVQSSLASPTACVSEPFPSAQEFEQLCQSPLYAGQGGMLSLWLDALQRGTNASRTPTPQTSVTTSLDRAAVVVVARPDDREARATHDRPLASGPGTPATPTAQGIANTTGGQSSNRSGGGKPARKKHYTSYISFFSMRDRPASPPPPSTSGVASSGATVAGLAMRHDTGEDAGDLGAAEANCAADASEARRRVADANARLMLKSGKAISLAAPRGFHSVLDEIDVSATSFSAAGLNSTSSAAKESHQTATTHTTSSHSQGSAAAPLRRSLRAESDASSTALSSMLERSSTSGRLATTTSHHGSESVSRSFSGVDARSHSSSWHSINRGTPGQGAGGNGRDSHGAAPSGAGPLTTASPSAAVAGGRGSSSPATAALAPTTPNAASEQVRRNAPVVLLCEPFTTLPHHAALATAVISPGSARRSRFSLLSESIDRRVSSGSSCNASRVASSFSDSAPDIVSADVQAEAATTSTAIYSASDDGADLLPSEVIFTNGKEKGVAASPRAPSTPIGGRTTATVSSAAPEALGGRPGSVPPPPSSSSLPSAPASSDAGAGDGGGDEDRDRAMADTASVTASTAVMQPAAVVVVDEEASCPRTTLVERKGGAITSWRQKGEAASILYRSSLSRASRSSRSAHNRTPVNANSSITSTHSDTEGGSGVSGAGEATAAIDDAKASTASRAKSPGAVTEEPHLSQRAPSPAASTLVSSDAARPRRTARRRLTTTIMATHHRHATSPTTAGAEGAGAKQHVTVTTTTTSSPTTMPSTEAAPAIALESRSPSMPPSLGPSTPDAATLRGPAAAALVAQERISLPSSALSSAELREAVEDGGLGGRTGAVVIDVDEARAATALTSATPTVVATSPEARTAAGPRLHTQTASVDIGDSTSAPLLSARANAMLFPSFAHQASAYGSFVQGSQPLFGELLPSPGISVGYETVTNSFEHDAPLSSMQSLKANDDETTMQQSLNVGGFAHFAAARTPTSLQAPAPPPAMRTSRQASVGSHSPNELANSCEHSTSLIPSLLYVRRDLLKGQEWSQLSTRLANIAATTPSPSVDAETTMRGKDVRGSESRVRSTTKSKSRQIGGAGRRHSATRSSRGAEARTTSGQPDATSDGADAQGGVSGQTPMALTSDVQPPSWPASPTMRTPHAQAMASLTSVSSSLSSVAATATPFDGGEAANYAPVPVRRSTNGVPRSSFARHASETERGALRTPLTTTSVSEGHGISWDDSTTSQSFTTPTVRPASHTQTLTASADGKPASGVVVVPSHETVTSAVSSPAGPTATGDRTAERKGKPTLASDGAVPAGQRAHASATTTAAVGTTTWSSLRASQPAPQLHSGAAAMRDGDGDVGGSADAAQKLTRRPSTSTSPSGSKRPPSEASGMNGGSRVVRGPPRAPPPPPPPVPLTNVAGAIAVPAPPSTQGDKTRSRSSGSKPGVLPSNAQDVAGRNAGGPVGGTGGRRGSAGSRRDSDTPECVNSHGLNLTPVVSAPLWPSYASITYERRVRQDGSKVGKTQALLAAKQSATTGAGEEGGLKGQQSGVEQRDGKADEGGTANAQLPQGDATTEKSGQGARGGGMNRVGSTVSLGSRRELWGPFPATITDDLDTSFTFSVLSGVTEATEATVSPSSEQRPMRCEGSTSARGGGNGSRSKSRQGRVQTGTTQPSSVTAKRRGGATTSTPRLQRTDSASSIVSCSSSRASMKLYTFKEKNTAGPGFTSSGRKTKPKDISRASSIRSRSGSMRRRGNKQSPRMMPPPPPPPSCTFPQAKAQGVNPATAGSRATGNDGGDTGGGVMRGKVLVTQPTVELLRMHTRDSASQNSLNTRHPRSGDDGDVEGNDKGVTQAAEDSASDSSSLSHGDSASSVVSSILACSLTTGLRNFSSNTTQDDWHFFSSATAHGVSSTSSTATRSNAPTPFTPHFGNSTGNNSDTSGGLTRDGTMSSFRTGVSRAGASTRGVAQPHHHNSNVTPMFATARAPGAPTISSTPKKAKPLPAQTGAEPSSRAQGGHSATPQVGTLSGPSLEGAAPPATPDEAVTRSEDGLTVRPPTDTATPSGQKTAGQGGRTWTIPYPPQVPRPPATRTGGSNTTVSGRREGKQGVRRR